MITSRGEDHYEFKMQELILLEPSNVGMYQMANL